MATNVPPLRRLDSQGRPLDIDLPQVETNSWDEYSQAIRLHPRGSENPFSSAPTPEDFGMDMQISEVSDSWIVGGHGHPENWNANIRLTSGPTPRFAGDIYSIPPTGWRRPRQPSVVGDVIMNHNLCQEIVMPTSSLRGEGVAFTSSAERERDGAADHLLDAIRMGYVSIPTPIRAEIQSTDTWNVPWGLGKVSNTSDADKPMSSGLAEALSKYKLKDPNVKYDFDVGQDTADKEPDTDKSWTQLPLL